MNGFRFEVSCKLCGGEVEEVALGNVVGSECRAVVRCEPCRKDFLVGVFMATVKELELPGARLNLGPVECGTDRGYRQHRRDDEEACGPCRAAHAGSQSGWKATTRPKAAGVFTGVS